MLKILFTAALTMTTLSAGTAHAQESAANRKDKTASVTIEAIGFTLMPVSGIRAGYFITPDLTAEVAYATGGAKILDFEADKTVIEAKAKWFIGNSFYVDGGLANESWKVQYSVLTSSTGTGTETLNGSVSSTGLSLHVGNQWQWSGFTLGCDWVGYFLALSTTSSFGSSSSVDDDDKKDEEESIKNTMAGSGVHVARFYLGWSF